MPLIPAPDDPDDAKWFDPVDRPIDSSSPVKLGLQVADIIKKLVETETIKGEKGRIRRVVPGDIMILVQRRSAIFDQIIQSCKAAELPVAGSDRLKMAGELAVRDLLALLAFLTLPEDDLSLCAVLRSPLFGLSEADVFNLAATREPKTTVWDALKRRAEVFSETVETLELLRRRADYLRPFELLELVLNDLGGRRKLLARLGYEAEDGIDELLNQALSFEQEEVPSITAFLTRIQSDGTEIKRDADSADDLIQIMTVHGAKGLERPIVILPDTTAESRDTAGGLLTGEDGMPLLSLSKAESPPRIRIAKERRKEADQAERNRLLYVAMTRAESWLIVAGAGMKNSSKDDLNWHAKVKAGMESAGAGVSPLDPDGLRLEHGDWPQPMEPKPWEDSKSVSALPQFLEVGAKQALVTASPISPSDMSGEKVLGGGALDEAAAKRRGRQIHLLMEHLPGQAEPESVARRLLAFGPDRAEEGEVAELYNQAMRNLTLHPELFAPGTLAEVDISAQLSSVEGDIAGTIDRLIVKPDVVQAVDFKTNSIVPDSPEDTPEGLLRQMGAYLEGLEKVYPDKAIEVAILWTETCNLMVLPHAIVRDALRRYTIS